jgi:hypothetical protein
MSPLSLTNTATNLWQMPPEVLPPFWPIPLTPVRANPSELPSQHGASRTRCHTQ